MRHLVLIPGLSSDRAVWERSIAALGTDVQCVVADTGQDDSLVVLEVMKKAASRVQPQMR